MRSDKATHLSTLKGEVIYMTPTHARELLEYTKKMVEVGKALQRPLMRNAVADYEGQVRANKWQLTAQPIVLDENGCVLDGQHRLTAIVNCNVTVPVFLVTGGDSKTFAFYDQGVSRSTAQIVGMAHGPRGTAASYRAALASRAIVWHADPTGVTINSALFHARTNHGLNRNDTVEFFGDHKADIEWALHTTQGMGKLITVTDAGTCAYIILQSTGLREDAETFFRALRDGVYTYEDGRAEALKTDDPVWTLRERLTANALATGAAKGKMRRDAVVWAVLITWNRWINQESTRTYLRIPTEPLRFPEISNGTKVLHRARRVLERA